MKTGKERRKEIMERLKISNQPIKGSEFAQDFDVSRQVIVQDIALLRAHGEQVISTAEGYLHLSFEKTLAKRVICVSHDKEAIEDELFSIVDLGGNIMNVIVTHPIYGEINVDMMIKTRQQVIEFMKKVREHDFIPLMHLTGGEHYHTIEASDEETLDDIEKVLLNKGYLVHSHD